MKEEVQSPLCFLFRRGKEKGRREEGLPNRSLRRRRGRIRAGKGGRRAATPSLLINAHPREKREKEEKSPVVQF